MVPCKWNADIFGLILKCVRSSMLPLSWMYLQFLLMSDGWMQTFELCMRDLQWLFLKSAYCCPCIDLYESVVYIIDQCHLRWILLIHIQLMVSNSISLWMMALVSFQWMHLNENLYGHVEWYNLWIFLRWGLIVFPCHYIMFVSWPINVWAPPSSVLKFVLLYTPAHPHRVVLNKWIWVIWLISLLWWFVQLQTSVKCSDFQLWQRLNNDKSLKLRRQAIFLPLQGAFSKALIYFCLRAEDGAICCIRQNGYFTHWNW